MKLHAGVTVAIEVGDRIEVGYGNEVGHRIEVGVRAVKAQPQLWSYFMSKRSDFDQVLSTPGLNSDCDSASSQSMEYLQWRGTDCQLGVPVTLHCLQPFSLLFYQNTKGSRRLSCSLAQSGGFNVPAARFLIQTQASVSVSTMVGVRPWMMDDLCLNRIMNVLCLNRMQVFRENREAAKRNKQAALELEGQVASEPTALPTLDLSPGIRRQGASEPPLAPPRR